MNGNNLSATTAGFGLSVVVTSILSMVLVFIKETHEETVLAWMKSLTTHHWITHGIIDVILFIVLGVLLSKVNGGKGIPMKAGTLGALLAAAAIINLVGTSGFFLL